MHQFLNICKKSSLAFLLAFVLYPVFSINQVELKTFFTSKDIERVKKDEIITRMYIKNNAVGENTDLSINIPSTKYISEDFSVYEMITDEKAFIPYKAENNEQRLKFYNSLTAFSKLAGMNYYSRRIKKIEKMILSCYRIESPAKTKPLNDIVYTQISEKVNSYFIQKDNKFGKLKYSSELFNEGDNFILINKCFEPIRIGLIISDKEEFKVITYFIYDKTDGGFYYYSANVMRIRTEFVLSRNKILTLYPTTFSNRLRAATVHLIKLLGLNWDDKINPWDEDKLAQGFYKNY
jgi:hypothetical protein